MSSGVREGEFLSALPAQVVIRPSHRTLHSIIVSLDSPDIRHCPLRATTDADCPRFWRGNSDLRYTCRIGPRSCYPALE